jgi:hypothetical protein
MRITPEMMFPNGIDEDEMPLLAAMFSPDGLARACQWECEDGWIVEYTTERIRHSANPDNNGKFAVAAFKPYGKGARSDPQRWKRVYWRTFAKRKSARARAEAIYFKHSPKAAQREHEWQEKYGTEEAQTA